MPKYMLNGSKALKRNAGHASFQPFCTNKFTGSLKLEKTERPLLRPSFRRRGTADTRPSFDIFKHLRGLGTVDKIKKYR